MSNRTWTLIAALAIGSFVSGCGDGDPSPSSTGGTGGTGGQQTTTTTSTTDTGGTGGTGGMTGGTGGTGGMAAVCGDGSITGDEGCDDSNTEAGDGCDAVCQVETGFDCLGEPSDCKAVC